MALVLKVALISEDTTLRAQSSLLSGLGADGFGSSVAYRQVVAAPASDRRTPLRRRRRDTLPEMIRRLKRDQGGGMSETVCHGLKSKKTTEREQRLKTKPQKHRTEVKTWKEFASAVVIRTPIRRSRATSPIYHRPDRTTASNRSDESRTYTVAGHRTKARARARAGHTARRRSATGRTDAVGLNAKRLTSRAGEPIAGR